MSGQDLIETIEHTETKAVAKTDLKEPGRYKVILLNDDYTPMPFVIEVLRLYFYMSQEKATQVMLDVHFHGRGICGVYTCEIAETKVALVNDYARAHDHPLMCMMEPE